MAALSIRRLYSRIAFAESDCVIIPHCAVSNQAPTPLRTNINKDIQCAREIMQKCGTSEAHDKVYPFTNENLNKYYPLLDMNGKDVLTVAASGDHAINAVTFGAKNVTTYDKNQLAYYWQDLKRAGIMSLDRDDFVNSFMSLLNKDKYKKVRSELRDDTLDFWDELFDEYSSFRTLALGNKVGPSRLFKVDVNHSIPLNIKANAYLQNSEYLETRKKLGKMEFGFVRKDITWLPSEFGKEKFDRIVTSNIADYIPSDLYVHFAGHGLRDMLKEGGIAQTHINYGCGMFGCSYDGDFGHWESSNPPEPFKKQHFQCLRDWQSVGSIITIEK